MSTDPAERATNILSINRAWKDFVDVPDENDGIPVFVETLTPGTYLSKPCSS